MTSDISNELILAVRLLLATLFLIFGWRKLRDYPGTVSQMVRDGLSMPVTATRDLSDKTSLTQNDCRRDDRKPSYADGLHVRDNDLSPHDG